MERTSQISLTSSTQGRARASCCNRLSPNGGPYDPATDASGRFQRGKLLGFHYTYSDADHEAVGTKWSEIDLAEKVWTVPASRMKSKRTHRVPLSSQACSLLEGLEIDPDPKAYVFPGQIKNAPLSPSACAAVLKSLEPTGTVHGMRSAFRDYASNETHAPREIAEAAFAFDR